MELLILECTWQQKEQKLEEYFFDQSNGLQYVANRVAIKSH